MLEYAIHGHGPTRAIALHGLFGDQRSFQPILAAIDPESWSIALLDIRGYGRSAAIGGPFTMATIASDAIEIADHLGWDNFAVIGHSMGGKAALRLAIDAPTRVDRLVGIAPIWAGRLSFDAEQLAFFRSSVERVEAREAIIARSTGNRLPAFWCKRMAEISSKSSSRSAYAGYLESFVHEDFEAAAAALNQEVLIMAGARDNANVEMARTHWKPKLRHAELVVLQDCGHWPIHEAPLHVAALLEQFLSKTRSTTA